MLQALKQILDFHGGEQTSNALFYMFRNLPIIFQKCTWKCLRQFVLFIGTTLFYID